MVNQKIQCCSVFGSVIAPNRMQTKTDYCVVHAAMRTASAFLKTKKVNLASIQTNQTHTTVYTHDVTRIIPLTSSSRSTREMKSQ